MKCLVLGGGGFIGSLVSDRLLANGHGVRIFDRPNVLPYRRFGADEQIEWLSGDFMNAADMDKALDCCEVVFHFIWTTVPSSAAADPVFDVETNIVGTLKLLQAAIRHRVRKVVFISSGGTVYGPPKQIPITEDHPTEPIVPYGMSKLAVEKYLHIFQTLYGLEYVVLRVANAFGERQRLDRGQGAVAAFLKKALSGEEIEIWGDGSVTRDYVYIPDVADAFVRVVTHAPSSRVFNIGSGEGRSVNDVLAAIESVLGKPVKRRYLPARGFDVQVNILSIERARSELGWKPKWAFHDGLRKTADWMRRIV